VIGSFMLLTFAIFGVAWMHALSQLNRKRIQEKMHAALPTTGLSTNTRFWLLFAFGPVALFLIWFAMLLGVTLLGLG
jgi:hypothetical protein